MGVVVGGGRWGEVRWGEGRGKGWVGRAQLFGIFPEPVLMGGGGVRGVLPVLGKPSPYTPFPKISPSPPPLTILTILSLQALTPALIPPSLLHPSPNALVPTL